MPVQQQAVDVACNFHQFHHSLHFTKSLIVTRPILFIILYFLGTSCLAQTRNDKKPSFDNYCRDNWQYSILQDSIKGQIIFHAKPYFLCGLVATASLTIARTTAGDTIRIIDLCNSSDRFRQLVFVKVIPAPRPEFSVSIPADKSHNDCRIKKTYYGHLILLNER